MPSKGELPTIFAQRTERNERISSLLSSVLMRSINPQFTYAIRRHPLSLWTTELCINVESKNDKQGVPTVLFVENTDASNSSIRTISRILKKEASESGLLVAVHSIQSHSR